MAKRRTNAATAGDYHRAADACKVAAERGDKNEVKRAKEQKAAVVKDFQRRNGHKAFKRMIGDTYGE